jgi:2-keto-4-pentenoate hydratase/2-oxohepta-3-ene-1,7-dioic acid hydratase in catechol pathway
MKLVSFSTGDGSPRRVRPGVLSGDTVIDLSAGYADSLAVIAAGVTSAPSGPTLPLAQVKLHAPLANPPRVFAIGLNYRGHAAETKSELPNFPVVFFKMHTAIIGPGESIVLPKNSAQPDYEAELGFVIGKGGFRIPAAAWREHVYGYTIINDVSARDVQRSTSQWSLAKSFPTFCPMGPAIVTQDEVADPHALAIGLSIDGEVLQNSNTNELIFGVPDLIEYISSITPLLAGDVVSTGTPAGVGAGRNPKRWLKPGETVTVTVEKLGSLTNPVAAE